MPWQSVSFDYRPRLDQIIQLLQRGGGNSGHDCTPQLNSIIELLTQGNKIMSQLDDDIAALQAVDAALATKVTAAVAALQAVPQKIADAVAAAIAAGATPAQLASLEAVSADVTAEVAALDTATTAESA